MGHPIAQGPGQGPFLPESKKRTELSVCTKSLSTEKNTEGHTLGCCYAMGYGELGAYMAKKGGQRINEYRNVCTNQRHV